MCSLYVTLTAPWRKCKIALHSPLKQTSFSCEGGRSVALVELGTHAAAIGMILCMVCEREREA